MILDTRYWIRVLGTALEIIAVPVIYKNRSPPQTVCVVGPNNRAEGILLLYIVLSKYSEKLTRPIVMNTTLHFSLNWVCLELEVELSPL